MKYIITAVLLITFNPNFLYAQRKTEINVNEMITSQNFIFKAQSVFPQTGGVRQLTSSDYDLKISKESVVSWLPYFGRAYAAPINPSEGGIKFTSSKFEYLKTKKNKNRWDITIRPKDVSDVQTLYLTVNDDGRASLRVNSINRQSISFDGYIEENKPVNKKAF